MRPAGQISVTWRILIATPLVLSLAAPLAGCAGSGSKERDETIPAARSTAPAEPGSAAAAAEAPAVERVTLPEPVVARLAAGIEALSVRTANPSPGTVAEAFRALAAALELVSGTASPSIRALRAAADRVAAAPPDAAVATEKTIEGLEAFMEALTTASAPPDRPEQFRAAVNSLSAAVEEIDRGRSLVAEGRPVVRALAAAADAVLLAGGQPARYGSAQPSMPAGSRRAFRECFPQVRSRVRALAAAKYPREREAAARALAALADCLAAAPGKTEAVEKSIGEIRFETARIRAAPALAPRETLWIRGALLAALAALDGLATGDGASSSTWVAAGRRATEAIDGESGLVFQRAPVQDAFRAVVDALAAAARTEGSSQD